MFYIGKGIVDEGSKNVRSVGREMKRTLASFSSLNEKRKERESFPVWQNQFIQAGCKEAVHIYTHIPLTCFWCPASVLSPPLAFSRLIMDRPLVPMMSRLATPRSNSEMSFSCSLMSSV